MNSDFVNDLSESFRSRGSRALHESFGIKNNTRNFLKSPNMENSESVFTPRGRVNATNNVDTMEADTLNSSLNKYQRRTRKSNLSNSGESNGRDDDKNNSGRK